MTKTLHCLRTGFVLSLACGAAHANHNPPPLPDPIPGTIPTSPFTLELADLASSFEFPTNVAAAPDGSNRLFVTERAGRVWLIENGSVLSTPFLDISATTVNDAGSALSVIAFHPDFAQPGAAGERKFYTLSQEAADTAAAHFPDAGAVHQSILYEWQASVGNPNLADPSTRREILRIDDRTTVHNANDLAFDPDGTLYIAIGDDDLDDDDELNGSTPDGSILRIDVDDVGGNGRYTIPSDNPYVGNGDGILSEIFAWGFRNPWRITIHPSSGELYAADIGEDGIEEFDLISAGGNFGWNDKEGSFAFLGFGGGVTDDLTDLPPDFDGIDPVAEYDHTEGDRSITGGFFYRGNAIPALAGHYIFGDFVSGRLMHLDPVSGVIHAFAIDPGGAALAPGLIGFGESPDREILLVITETNFNPTGRVVEVVAGGAPDVLPDGDVNLDGAIDIRDLLLLKRELLGLASLPLASAWHADLHPSGGGDGSVTLSDLVALESRLTAP